MTLTSPFGDLDTAVIMVIGHDPRLQRSRTQAAYAFFLDYLTRDRPEPCSEQRKYDLAQAVMDYLGYLAGRQVSPSKIYATNLCNEYLPKMGSGTVLIPDDMAKRGVAAICEAVTAAKRLRVILPMAVQPFYHLCRHGFVEDWPELVAAFRKGACPSENKAAELVYQPTGKAPFLAVCGQLFHHKDTPVVPIVHVKQWPLKAQFVRYTEPMALAARHVRQALNAEGRERW